MGGPSLPGARFSRGPTACVREGTFLPGVKFPPAARSPRKWEPSSTREFLFFGSRPDFLMDPLPTRAKRGGDFPGAQKRNLGEGGKRGNSRGSRGVDRFFVTSRFPLFSDRGDAIGARGRDGSKGMTRRSRDETITSPPRNSSFRFYGRTIFWRFVVCFKRPRLL